MHILYIHQYFKFSSEKGGTRSYDLSKSFALKGHSVDVITSTSDKKYKKDKRWSLVEIDGICVHYIYLPYNNSMSYAKRALVFFQFLYFASIKTLNLESDVVLASSTPLTIGIPALIKKWRHKTPFVFEARDVWPEAVIAIGAIKNKVMQRMLYMLEKIIYRNASAIVPLSTDMKMSIVSRYPDICKEKPIVTIENISEIERFTDKKKSNILEKAIGFKPRFSVLYAGTFGRVNGIDYVVDFAAKTILLDSSIVYVLMGGGAIKDSVIKYAKEKGVLNKNVFILDSVSKDALPGWYSVVDMGSSFVIPIKELWANSANKFFDTLAASKPILINHEGWQAKVIREDNLGYVLPDVLTDDAIKDFVGYTQNTELHLLQSENAFKKAKDSYSLDIAVEKYLEIFNSVSNV